MTIELCLPVDLVEISTAGHIVDLPKRSSVFNLERKENKELEREGIQYMYSPRPQAHSQLFNVACWKAGEPGDEVNTSIQNKCVYVCA